MKNYFVYIIEGERTSKKNKRKKILYTGFTDNPQKRLQEHRTKKKSNFMKIFQIIPKKIVYLEQVKGYMNALIREKQIKKMPHNKKITLIKTYMGY